MRAAPLPDPRLDALAAFTRVMIETRGHVPEPALDAFVAAGFTAEQALEVVAQLGFTRLEAPQTDINGDLSANFETGNMRPSASDSSSALRFPITAYLQFLIST